MNTINAVDGLPFAYDLDSAPVPIKLRSGGATIKVTLGMRGPTGPAGPAGASSTRAIIAITGNRTLAANEGNAIVHNLAAAGASAIVSPPASPAIGFSFGLRSVDPLNGALGFQLPAGHMCIFADIDTPVAALIQTAARGDDAEFEYLGSSVWFGSYRKANGWVAA